MSTRYKNIPQQTLEQARQLDLLTYLERHEPDNLERVSGNEYRTRDHDSLRISNGKWYWWSRGIGGASALDYLIKVRGYGFVEAVEMITGRIESDPSFFIASKKQVKREKVLILPEKCSSNDKIIEYLTGRGIDREIIDYCIENDLLYESLPYHSAVFVGYDSEGVPKYASIRGTVGSYKGEASGSDKRFSFRLTAEQSESLYVFESAIDLLSFATLQKRNGNDWQTHHLLSLAGVYRSNNSREGNIPLALENFLAEHQDVKRIYLCLDNDKAGRDAAECYGRALEGKYEVHYAFPKKGKDYNEFLCVNTVNKCKKTALSR
ncbi:MAG: DUF3991 and TOPRIM domain-containing protein [Eubacteriaceae bacterium]|nr:DUF3991 and TOPRIM domain-containing protein [Eubacteriaceae bacterium]